VDVNVRAFRVVQAAINEKAPVSKKKEASRQGGLKGGPARARSISRERRVEIAKKASEARWGEPHASR
jgi:hypothetical protein